MGLPVEAPVNIWGEEFYFKMDGVRDYRKPAIAADTRNLEPLAESGPVLAVAAPSSGQSLQVAGIARLSVPLLSHLVPMGKIRDSRMYSESEPSGVREAFHGTEQRRSHEQ